MVDVGNYVENKVNLRYNKPRSIHVRVKVKRAKNHFITGPTTGESEGKKKDSEKLINRVIFLVVDRYALDNDSDHV